MCGNISLPLVSVYEQLFANFNFLSALRLLKLQNESHLAHSASYKSPIVTSPFNLLFFAEQISCLFRVKSKNYHYEQEGVGVDNRDCSFLYVHGFFFYDCSFCRARKYSSQNLRDSSFHIKRFHYSKQIMLFFIICILN